MFHFLKYINPGSYYRLIHQMPQPVLMDKVNINIQDSLHYKDSQSFELDILYQLLQSGNIPFRKQNRNERQNETVSNVHDNYVFIRRYFSLPQLLFVFFIRLCSLKKPINELMFFFNAFSRVNRLKISPVNYSKWDSFDSSLIDKKPLVTVVIPTLNRYEYLKDVMYDLENQDYHNFEVIVVDQSEPVDVRFYEGWKLDIQLIQQDEKALWLARNKAILASKGEYILLFDDDSRVEKSWIKNHLKCIDFFNIKISAGVTHTLVGGGLGRKDTYFHLSDVFDTGNAMVHKSVFVEVGLFDRQFEKQRMGDAEFGLRTFLGGFNIVSNPFAKRIHLKVDTGGLRQMGSWDALRPKSLFAPRPVPSVLYFIRNYYGYKEAIFYLIKNIPQSYMPYKFKNNKFIRLMYSMAFPLILPVAFFAVMKSWRLASEKIKVGPLIARLN